MIEERKTRRHLATTKLSHIQKKMLVNFAKRQLLNPAKDDKLRSLSSLNDMVVNDDLYCLPSTSSISEKDESGSSDESDEFDYNENENSLEELIKTDELLLNDTLQELPLEIQQEILHDLLLQNKRNYNCDLNYISEDVNRFSDLQLKKFMNRNQLLQKLDAVKTKLFEQKSNSLLQSFYFSDFCSDSNFENKINMVELETELSFGRIASSEFGEHYVLLKNSKATLENAPSQSMSGDAEIIVNDCNIPICDNSSNCESGSTHDSSNVHNQFINPFRAKNRIEQNNVCEPAIVVDVCNGDKLNILSTQTAVYNDTKIFQTDEVQQEDADNLYSPVSVNNNTVCNSASHDETEEIYGGMTVLFDKISGDLQSTDDVSLLKENVADDDDDDFIDVNEAPVCFDNDNVDAAVQPDTDTVDIATSDSDVSFVSNRQIDYSETALDDELNLLTQEAKVQKAQAMTMTDQIYQECQELLTLFGIPFLVAAGEAEAQCAWLAQNNLVQLVASDDSDSWLFGAPMVIRHMFSKKHQMKKYTAVDVMTALGLDREKMILLALLCGCDYSVGVTGIGVVTAVEILAEFFEATAPTNFESLQILEKFKKWYEMREVENDANEFSEVKSRLYRMRLEFPSGFPNAAIFNSFLRPTVDSSEEKFIWGIPDIDKLKEFALLRLCWPHNKIESLLLPAVERWNESNQQVQRKIADYFIPCLINSNATSYKIKRITFSTGDQRIHRAIKKLKSVSAPSTNDNLDFVALEHNSSDYGKKKKQKVGRRRRHNNSGADITDKEMQLDLCKPLTAVKYGKDQNKEPMCKDCKRSDVSSEIDANHHGLIRKSARLMKKQQQTACL